MATRTGPGFVKEVLLKECEENPNSFREEIINTRTPCKLIGGFKETEFECLSSWSNAYLREKCREETETVIVEVKEDDDEVEEEGDKEEGEERRTEFGKGTRERMQFADFMTAFERGDHRNISPPATASGSDKGEWTTGDIICTFKEFSKPVYALWE